MNRCRSRYTIGATIIFLVCNRDELHDGNHWDRAIELSWSTAIPEGEDAS